MKDCDFIPENYHQAYSVQRAIRQRSFLVSILILLMTVWWVAHRSHVATANAMIAHFKTVIPGLPS